MALTKSDKAEIKQMIQEALMGQRNTAVELPTWEPKVLKKSKMLGIEIADTNYWEIDEDGEKKEYWWIDTGSIPMVRKSNNPILSIAEDIDKEIGNYFETKEEAEKAVEKLKAWKRLKEKGFEFVGWQYDVTNQKYIITMEEKDFEEWVVGSKKADLDLLFSQEVKNEETKKL